MANKKMSFKLESKKIVEKSILELTFKIMEGGKPKKIMAVADLRDKETGAFLETREIEVEQTHTVRLRAEDISDKKHLKRVVRDVLRAERNKIKPKDYSGLDLDKLTEDVSDIDDAEPDRDLSEELEQEAQAEDAKAAKKK